MNIICYLNWIYKIIENVSNKFDEASIVGITEINNFKKNNENKININWLIMIYLSTLKKLCK